MRTNELMLYKNMEYGEILKDITFLIGNYESEFYNKEDLRGLLFDCINELLELSVSHGFEGNLWHTYLTFLLASDENAYSTSCEIVGEIEGSLNEIALHDFAIFKEMFDYDFEELEKSLDADCLKIIMDYKSGNSGGKVFNRRVRDRICDLSRALAATQNVEHFKRTLTQFYKEFGVGKLGLHKAFRVEHPENSDVEIIPITNIAHVHLDDLVGYEDAKKKLVDNTKAFVEGKKANQYYEIGQQKPFACMSLKPGLGDHYYEEHKAEIWRQGYIQCTNGKHAQIPRYYEKMMEAENPQRLWRIKKNRQAAAIAENRLKYENADFAEQCETKERVIKKQTKKRGTL